MNAKLTIIAAALALSFATGAYAQRSSSSSGSSGQGGQSQQSSQKQQTEQWASPVSTDTSVKRILDFQIASG
jgi:hypothetical protein